ncbi:MAG: hypothetical protein LUC94_05840, partial [Clostridiales bacterium]|nr:hypothetical protein [Clostridiales bacterium]
RYLEKVPKWLDKFVGLVAKLTLDIYLVQYVLIDVIRNLNLLFPLNWIALTALIAVSAFVLHTVVDIGTKRVTKLLARKRICTYL